MDRVRLRIHLPRASTQHDGKHGNCRYRVEKLHTRFCLGFPTSHPEPVPERARTRFAGRSVTSFWVHVLTGSARMRRKCLESRCWGSQPTKACSSRLYPAGKECSRRKPRAKPVLAELVQNAFLEIFVYERQECSKVDSPAGGP